MSRNQSLEGLCWFMISNLKLTFTKDNFFMSCDLLNRLTKGNN